MITFIRKILLIILIWFCLALGLIAIPLLAVATPFLIFLKPLEIFYNDEDRTETE